MKKLLLSLFVIAPMVPVTAAASTPVGGLVPLLLVAPKRPATAPTSASPGATPGVQPAFTCEGALDKMVAEIKAGKMIAGVNSTLIVGETALAESPHFPLGAGFNPSGGNATRSGETIVGTSHVAAPGTTSGADLKFTIDKYNGKARLKWTHAGKSYTSVVDGCASGYWIASSANSAIAIKLGGLVSPPE
jgi:FlaG/FlaF family flagellin (archaellin)